MEVSVRLETEDDNHKIEICKFDSGDSVWVSASINNSNVSIIAEIDIAKLEKIIELLKQVHP